MDYQDRMDCQVLREIAAHLDLMVRTVPQVFQVRMVLLVCQDLTEEMASVDRVESCAQTESVVHQDSTA